MSRIVTQSLVMTVVLVILALVAAPAAAAPSQGPMNTSVHVVQPGQTLYSIARAYGVNVFDIAMANHLVNPNVIFAGQRLVIPGGYAPPQHGPPAYQPAPHHPAPSAHVYVVRPGETLYSIAMRFGTSVHALAAANNITNANLVFAGQRLVIPDGHPGYGHPGYSPPDVGHHPPAAVVKKVVVVEKKDNDWHKDKDWGKDHKPKAARCNDATRITFPRNGETLNFPGTHSILGTASIEDFQFYKLELAAGTTPLPSEFNSIAPVQTQAIVNGILYRDWNTGALPEGTYTLRLTVVDESGNFPPACELIVHIDHHSDRHTDTDHH